MHLFRSCRVAAAAAALALTCGVPALAAGASNVMAPIDGFVAAANRGDKSQVVAQFAPDASIVDEFAPFRFPAPMAAAHWFDGFGADAQANGVTAGLIATSKPKFVTIRSNHAYVVVPTVYTYKLKGKPAKETGSLAFALTGSGGRWKISAMAWAKTADTSVP